MEYRSKSDAFSTESDCKDAPWKDTDLCAWSFYSPIWLQSWNCQPPIAGDWLGCTARAAPTQGSLCQWVGSYKSANKDEGDYNRTVAKKYELWDIKAWNILCGSSIGHQYNSKSWPLEPDDGNIRNSWEGVRLWQVGRSVQCKQGLSNERWRKEERRR